MVIPKGIAEWIFKVIFEEIPIKHVWKASTFEVVSGQIQMNWDNYRGENNYQTDSSKEHKRHIMGKIRIKWIWCEFF